MLAGILPRLFGADAQAVHAADDDHGRLDHAQRPHQLARKVKIPGNINRVDHFSGPGNGSIAGADGKAALFLLRIKVGNGGSVLHLALAIRHSGSEEHRFGQRRLALAAMPHEGNVPNVGRCEFSHDCVPPVFQLSFRRVRQQGAPKIICQCQNRSYHISGQKKRKSCSFRQLFRLFRPFSAVLSARDPFSAGLPARGRTLLRGFPRYPVPAGTAVPSPAGARPCPRWCAGLRCPPLPSAAVPFRRAPCAAAGPCRGSRP